jgi:two-component system CheB/CheR fusion protein
LFNLLPTDQGRRLSDITARVKYDRLYADIREVLEHLTPIEREVATDVDDWYLMRIVPYRTTDDRIDGIVLTFVDITSRVRANLVAQLEAARGGDQLRFATPSIFRSSASSCSLSER